MTGKRWESMRDTIAEDLVNADKIATAMVKDEMTGVFANNANYTAYLIENDDRMNYGFTLYNTDTVANLLVNDPDILPLPSVNIPKDLRWNRQHITSAVLQGILQGESIQNLSKRLYNVVDMDAAAAVRTARTSMTSAQNAGRQQTYNRAASMGLNREKEWVATNDFKTRHAHGMVDGQRVGLTEAFEVDGCQMMHPGDMSAPGYLIYNCRCTTVTHRISGTVGGESRKTWSEWQYGKVKEELGSNAPKSLEEFKNIWYNKDKYKQFQAYSKSLISGELSWLVDFDLYEKVSSEIDKKLIGVMTFDGITVTGKSNHFIARCIGSVEQRRNGVQVSNAVKAITNPTNVIKYKKSIKYTLDGICDVTVNPDTGNLIQCNPSHRRRKSD